MKNWPNIAFHVEDLPILNTQWRVRKTISQLSHFENIRSVKVSINTTVPTASQLFNRLLTSCSNLEALHVRPEDNSFPGECSRARLRTSSTPFTDFAIIFEDAPAGMDFSIKTRDAIVSPREFVYETNKHGLPLIPTSSWDWSRLHHLEVRGPKMLNFLKSIEGRVNCLQVLILKAIECLDSDDWSPRQEATNLAMNEFLSSVHGLTILDVINCEFKLQLYNAFSQGETLKHLSYYTPRRCRAPGSCMPQPTVSIQDLQKLRTSCPNLKSLAVHVDIVTNDLVRSIFPRYQI